jgi:hypothetical protein
MNRIHRAAGTRPPPRTWRNGAQCAELLVEPSRFTNAMHLTIAARTPWSPAACVA